MRKLRQQIRLSHGKGDYKHIVLTSGEDTRVIRAAKQAMSSGDLKITLLGNETEILRIAKKCGISNFTDINIVDPKLDPRRAILQRRF